MPGSRSTASSPRTCPQTWSCDLAQQASGPSASPIYFVGVARGSSLRTVAVIPAVGHLIDMDAHWDALRQSDLSAEQVDLAGRSSVRVRRPGCAHDLAVEAINLGLDSSIPLLGRMALAVVNLLLGRLPLTAADDRVGQGLRCRGAGKHERSR
jgi:hypothetical protein